MCSKHGRLFGFLAEEIIAVNFFRSCFFSRQDKVNASKTPQNKGENRVAKRKLYSPGAALSEDEGIRIVVADFFVLESSGVNLQW